MGKTESIEEALSKHIIDLGRVIDFLSVFADSIESKSFHGEKTKAHDVLVGAIKELNFLKVSLRLLLAGLSGDKNIVSVCSDLDRFKINIIGSGFQIKNMCEKLESKVDEEKEIKLILKYIVSSADLIIEECKSIENSFR